MNKFVAKLNPLVLARVAMVLMTLLLISVSGLLSAQMVWQLFSPKASIVVPSVQVLPNDSASRLGQLAEQLASQSILGKPPAAVEPPPRPTPTPEPRPVQTPLSFELVGVMASSNPERGLAMIARSRGATAEVFRVGQDLYGQATLLAVYSNAIELDRNGSRQRLEFDQARAGGTAGLAPSLADLGGGMASVGGLSPEATPQSELNSSRGGGLRGTPTPGSNRGAGTNSGSPLGGAGIASRSDEGSGGSSASPPPSSSGVDDSIREFANNLLEQARRNPAALLAAYGLTATPEGYRVGSNARTLILTTQIRPGDLITQVNNMPVGNLDQDQARLDEFMAGGTISLTVQRGAETMRYSLTLPSLF